MRGFLTLIELEVFRQLSNRLLSRHSGLQVKFRPESVSRVFITLQVMPVPFAFRSLKNSPSENKAWDLFLVLTLRPGPAGDRKGEIRDYPANPAQRGLDGGENNAN
ncbi:hypothetical protein DO659_22260 [Salmonella enterica subsp. enterica serovar Minnesota]|nr:hypothetical protein [Salmonella enterica subsp. enterica serovar Minnesota]